MRWYSPRDWISCNDMSRSHDYMSGSHDHSHIEDMESSGTAIATNNSTNSSDVTSDDVTNNSNTTDDVTNNSNATDVVTKNSNDVSGWDEDWAELDEEQTSTDASEAPISHRVCNHYPHYCWLLCNHYPHYGQLLCDYYPYHC